MSDIGRYRINLNEEWSLEDLYKFPRLYEQLYYFYLSLDLAYVDLERVSRAYELFPWQGGYSAVDFFEQLKYASKPKARPSIVAIRKESPGYLDLNVLGLTAVTLSFAINRLCATINKANDTYQNIYIKVCKSDEY
jgi:hypothetical protein